MIINVSFRHMEASEALKEYVNDKSEKFKKYFQGKVHATWSFVVEKQEHIAHCHLVGNNMDYFGEAKTEDMYASVDLALEKIEKQLKKHKEIVTNHHK